MAILCFQYLAIYSNENLTKSVQIVPKWVKIFAQNQINLKYIAKVVEFRQIWSKWSHVDKTNSYWYTEV